MYQVDIVRVWIIDFIIDSFLSFSPSPSLDKLGIVLDAVDAKMLVIGSGGLQCWRGCLAIR